MIGTGVVLAFGVGIVLGVVLATCTIAIWSHWWLDRIV